jgi:hypothetical protein
MPAEAAAYCRERLIRLKPGRLIIAMHHAAAAAP